MTPIFGMTRNSEHHPNCQKMNALQRPQQAGYRASCTRACLLHDETNFRGISCIPHLGHLGLYPGAQGSENIMHYCRISGG